MPIEEALLFQNSHDTSSIILLNDNNNIKGWSRRL